MEQISALMDGELEHEEASRVIPTLNKQSDLREAWATYHLIGEALRGQACNDCAVAQTVSSKLAVEPTVLAPRRGPALSANAGLCPAWQPLRPWRRSPGWGSRHRRRKAPKSSQQVVNPVMALALKSSRPPASRCLYR